MTDDVYIVATVKPWNIENFARRYGKEPRKWHLVDAKNKLTLALVKRIKPRFIFFPHWSWLVPPEILDAAECVCFHMTDLPYGRGGSPLQNLIVRGRESTKVTALRMTQELDAGPVYLKRAFKLDGNAQEIYERASQVVFDMMDTMARKKPVARPQRGRAVRFVRRNPAQSILPDGGSLRSLYDHIRMLDAETYPRAYLDHGAFRIEFHDAEIGLDNIKARVTLTGRKRKRDAENGS